MPYDRAQEPASEDVGSPPTLVDRFGRWVNYLRLAITAKCNLGCRYCRPAAWSSASDSDSLTDEELVRLVRLFCRLGVKKVRITGGEPLVRPAVGELLAELRRVPGLQELHLTTNGVLLERFVPTLSALPVDGVNVSLDSLRPDRYAHIVGADCFGQVWTGIESALEAGLHLKLNVVVQAGVNDDEIGHFCELTRWSPLSVRFIELMPSGTDSHLGAWNVTATEIHRRIVRSYGTLDRLPPRPDTTAMLFRIPGYQGTIGIIPAYSRTFCDRCNRLRLTPDGRLKTCLYQAGGLDLRALLRSGVDDEAVANQVRRAVLAKPKDGRAAEETSPKDPREPMILVGG
ncbi:MAG: GTP 3',8-cyclase MoaA [candidate division KSB1 bacterium]|nr:GTP 3',8-cyclase MoaA [candidate division KSB1 bacterium]